MGTIVFEGLTAFRVISLQAEGLVPPLYVDVARHLITLSLLS